MLQNAREREFIHVMDFHFWNTPKFEGFQFRFLFCLQPGHVLFSMPHFQHDFVLEMPHHFPIWFWILGHFKEKPKCNHANKFFFTCFMAHELWFIIYEAFQSTSRIYIVIRNVYLAKIITSSHLNAFDLTFGSLLNKKSTQFSSFIFKSQGTPKASSIRFLYRPFFSFKTVQFHGPSI